MLFLCARCLFLCLPFIRFLVHLSRRLKCTIVITRLPSVRRPQVHYCDHASSVRPSSVVNLSHFRLLLWNRWTEFNETWQEARSQRPLPSLCFSGGSEKQNGRPGLWLAETFSTSPLKSLNGIQRNLTGSKISMSSTKFCFSGRSEKQHGRPGLWLAEIFSTSPLKSLNGIQRNLTGSKISSSSTKSVFFGPIGKRRWLSWPVIGWDIFDFSSETAERNSNETWQEATSQSSLSSVCFSGRLEKQYGRPGLWLAETFFTSPLKPLNGIQWNLTESKISTSSTKFVFFVPIGKTIWPPWPLIGWDIFDFSSETAERNSTKLDREQDLNVLYKVCVFRADRKNNMAALASDLLRHFWLLLWNRWTELKKNLTGSKISMSSIKFLFFGADRKNNMAALASEWPRHFRLLLCNRWTEFNETRQLARSQCLYQVCVIMVDQKTKMAALADSWKKWHIELRCTIYGSVGLLFWILVGL